MGTSYFITGTDTDVGKTLVARTLLLALAARGIRWMNDVWMVRRSMIGDTLPGMWSRLNSSALGNRSQTTSRAFSPPRMPVSQS